MKDLVTYINEVSKGLVQRAYNKATGSQKNRIKKLYKEIYGDNIEKSDISKIDFFIDNEYLEKRGIDDFYATNSLKDEFELWDQKLLDTIKRIKIIPDGETDSRNNLTNYTVDITIQYKNKEEDNFNATWKFDPSYGAYGYLKKSNIKDFKEDDYLSIATMIAYIYKQLSE